MCDDVGIALLQAMAGEWPVVQCAASVMVVNKGDGTAGPHTHESRRTALNTIQEHRSSFSRAWSRQDSSIHTVRGIAYVPEGKEHHCSVRTLSTAHNNTYAKAANDLYLSVHEAPELASAQCFLQDALGGEVKGSICATSAVDPVHSALTVTILQATRYTPDTHHNVVSVAWDRRLPCLCSSLRGGGCKQPGSSTVRLSEDQTDLLDNRGVMYDRGLLVLRFNR